MKASRMHALLGALVFMLVTAWHGPLVAEDTFGRDIHPLLQEYCNTCHSSEKQKGDLNLERFTSQDLARREPAVWEHALEQFANQEMPPKGKPQPSREQMQLLSAWMHELLETVAQESAGDPGPVVLRRLSNLEYTYTVRDLTGVASLDPAREFPVDGAAGEGFTNVGAALVMSPALLTKYLDAAKGIAAHAVLLPDGIRFAESTSSRDWTDEILAKIRAFYAGFSETGSGGTQVNLQGIKFETNAGGRLPVEKYLAALKGERDETGLNAKYLATLRNAMMDKTPSLLLDMMREKLRLGTLGAGDITTWQQALWRFSSVGHIGKENGPKAWQEPVAPLADRHEMRLKLAAPKDGGDVRLYLVTSDAGDGNDHDVALWENARLVAPGRPDLSLRDVRATVRRLEKQRGAVVASVARCLDAANEAEQSTARTDVAALAGKHGVDEAVLAAWLDYLGIGTSGAVKLEPLLGKKLQSTPEYAFIKGWTGDQALSVLANSSDATVRTPGTMKAHGVTAHPSPSQAVVIAWRSPVTGALTIRGDLQDAHPECGNGVTWAVELRRGHTREILARGVSDAAKLNPVGPFQNVRVTEGDVVTMVVGPRDGNHACDTTAVNLTLHDGKNEWNLAADVSPDILAGNPHADRLGHQAVWHFLSEPAARELAPAIPAESLLAKWRKTSDAAQRRELAKQVQQLLESQAQGRPEGSPDRALYRQLFSFSGPLLASALRAPAAGAEMTNGGSAYGIDPAQFGRLPDGGAAPAGSLAVKAPSVIEVRLPDTLADGAEFVASGTLHSVSGAEGSVQMQVLTERPTTVTGLVPCRALATTVTGQWSDNNARTELSTPVIVKDDGEARARFEQAFADFRALFPVALCYTKIVPVDEVVTLTLFYREDEALKRLMLDEKQAAELDRLWAELRYVSESPLKEVDVFEQLYQFATQDAKPSAFEPLREPIMRDAARFKDELRESEPSHVQAVLDFAGRAWRRPLTPGEGAGLQSLYQTMRRQELPHGDAVRALLARVLVASPFLYRGETPAPGAAASPVNDWELATRLSYFLWSSAPDDELRSLAAAGTLHESSVLTAQVRRMTRDARVRRLAVEFGCQWLQVRDIESLEEKSERHFPTFVNLRGPMQEEVVRFFTDLFQHDGSVLSLLDADHTFVNSSLATHYGMQAPKDGDWQRVNGIRAQGRGGILGFAATLAKQSGASRTSPILRGNWLSEVVLGEKLPRPPKGVPVLPDEAPAGLTERQLIERHSSDAACARCHRRIDPFGFALEGFDAIGHARAADTRATLPDGTTLEGLEGLRSYLVNSRRDDFLRQFCRKLLGYALGRSFQLSDKPLLDAMLAKLHADNYRMSGAIELIVTSDQFQKVRGRDFLTISH